MTSFDIYTVKESYPGLAYSQLAEFFAMFGCIFSMVRILVFIAFTQLFFHNMIVLY